MDSKTLQAILNSWLESDDLLTGYKQILVRYKLNPISDSPKILDAIKQDLASSSPKLKISEDNLVKLWNSIKLFRIPGVKKKIPESKYSLLEAAVQFPIISHILDATPVGMDILAMLDEE